MRAPTIHWIKSGQNSSAQLQVAYRGPLEGPDLRLHYGFDVWQEPVQEIKLEPVEPGLAVSEPLVVTGHISLDCVVTDGNRWDNNLDADYRLWIDFEPLDAHMHVSGRGSGELGISSLRTAMASAGIGYGIVSWFEIARWIGLKGSQTTCSLSCGYGQVRHLWKKCDLV